MAQAGPAMPGGDFSTNLSHWGKLMVTDGGLAMSADAPGQDDKLLFSLQSSTISRTTTDGKNLMIEMDLAGQALSEPALESVTVHVPDEAEVTAPDGSMASAAAIGDLLQAQMAQSRDGESGPVVAAIPELSCLTPRGNFTMQLYDDCLRLWGMSTLSDQQHTAFHIPYTNIGLVFLVPDARDWAPKLLVCVGLRTPMELDSQSQQCLVLEVDNRPWELQPQVTDEQRSRTLLPNILAGPKYKVLLQALKGLSGCKVLGASKTFESMDGKKAIRCVNKQCGRDGMLFPLDHFFLYITHPATFVRHRSIEYIIWRDLHKGAQECDLLLVTGAKTYTFLCVPVTEVHSLVSWIESKQCTGETLEKAKMSGHAEYLKAESEEDEGDAVDSAQDDDSEEEARVGGKRKSQAAGGKIPKAAKKGNTEASREGEKKREDEPKGGKKKKGDEVPPL